MKRKSKTTRRKLAAADLYSIESEKSGGTEFEEERKMIVTNLNESIKNRETVLEQTWRIRQNLGDVVRIVSDDLPRLRSMVDIYGNDRASLRRNPATQGSMDSMMRLSESDAQYSRHLATLGLTVSENVDTLGVWAKASGSTNTYNMSTLTVGLAETMANKESINQDVEVIKKPSPLDRRDELSSKFSAIQPRLSTKLNGAWHTLQDQSNPDRFLQAASSAGELISDTLSVLAPDDQVMGMDWFKAETDDGKPSQRQRARFAMTGGNKGLGETELTPVLELGKNIRDSYSNLSNIRHLRDYEKDLQGLTESLVDQCQIYLLKLLEMRDSYYKPIDRDQD